MYEAFVVMIVGAPSPSWAMFSLWVSWQRRKRELVVLTLNKEASKKDWEREREILWWQTSFKAFWQWYMNAAKSVLWLQPGIPKKHRKKCPNNCGSILLNPDIKIFIFPRQHKVVTIGGHSVRYPWSAVSDWAWYRNVRYRTEERRVRHYIRYWNELLSDIRYPTSTFVNPRSVVVSCQIIVMKVVRSKLGRKMKCQINLLGSLGNDW